MQLEPLGARALDTAVKRGAAYADIRFETNRSERIEARNGVVATLSDSISRGYGIRALVNGAWGFAAGSDLSPAGIDIVADSGRGHCQSRSSDCASTDRRAALQGIRGPVCNADAARPA